MNRIIEINQISYNPQGSNYENGNITYEVRQNNIIISSGQTNTMDSNGWMIDSIPNGNQLSITIGQNYNNVDTFEIKARFTVVGQNYNGWYAGIIPKNSSSSSNNICYEPPKIILSNINENNATFMTPSNIPQGFELGLIIKDLTTGTDEYDYGLRITSFMTPYLFNMNIFPLNYLHCYRIKWRVYRTQ